MPTEIFGIYVIAITLKLTLTFGICYWFMKSTLKHPPKNKWLLKAWKSNEKQTRFLVKNYWVLILIYLILLATGIYYGHLKLG